MSQNSEGDNTQNDIGKARYPLILGREACEDDDVSMAAESLKIAALSGSTVWLARLHQRILKRDTSTTVNKVVRYLLEQGADINMVPVIHIIRTLNENFKSPR
jgi:hypothetical protein